jgi:hypothetical protein
MREFSQTLSEFTKGLRPDANTPRNSGFATELYNTRCGVAGLEVPPLIIYPISGAPVVSWPLPQLIKIKGLTTSVTDLFFLSSTNPQYLYKVNSDYSLTIINSMSGSSPLDLGTPGRYTIADFGWYQVWHTTAHPTAITYRYFDDDLNTWYWRKYEGGGELPEYANITCVANFRGQLVAGLLSGASSVDGTKTYMVAWSRIGKVDIAQMFESSGDNIDKDSGVDLYKRTSGNYRIGPNTVPRRVLPLGNGVMVYCSDQIFYLRAVSSPEPTFGVVPIFKFGIPSTFCAEGDEHEHIFISANKEIWRIKEDLKTERLGYKEFITAMSGTLIISKNEDFGDYYISNGSKTYLLSSYGMTEWFQYPTSLVWEDANKRMIGPIAVGADTSAYMATDVVDFGVRGLKLITCMEAGSSGQTLTGNVDYKFKVTDAAFTSTAFKTFSNFGAVTPMISGLDFKMRVKGADYTKFDLDSLTVRYKYIDKRMIRGVYAKDAKVLSGSGR